MWPFTDAAATAHQDLEKTLDTYADAALDHLGCLYNLRDEQAKPNVGDAPGGNARSRAYLITLIAEAESTVEDIDSRVVECKAWLVKAGRRQPANTHGNQQALHAGINAANEDEQQQDQTQSERGEDERTTRSPDDQQPFDHGNGSRFVVAGGAAAAPGGGGDSDDSKKSSSKTPRSKLDAGSRDSQQEEDDEEQDDDEEAHGDHNDRDDEGGGEDGAGEEDFIRFSDGDGELFKDSSNISKHGQCLICALN